MSDRKKENIAIWNVCECGRGLHSIAEGIRGTCSSCWVKSMPSDTKLALNRLISAAFKGQDSKDAPELIEDVMKKLKRDRGQ